MTPLFLVAAFLLVVFGGLLAACDAAMVTLSRAELQETAIRARFRASLLAIAADTGAHINAVNFLRVLAETSAAVLVTLAFAAIVENPWLVLLIAAVIMTGVSFVLVGASPRSVGRTHPRGLLKAAAPIVRASRLILGPLANVLVWLGNRVTPGRARAASTFTSEEQLLSMVDEATELDVLEQVDRELIHSIFEWGDTPVREVMVPRTDMVTIESTSRADKAMRLLLDRALSRVPVRAKDADDIVGVLHLRDVARVLTDQTKKGPKPPTAAELARPVLFVPDSKKADETLRQMQSASNHLAMVVDEYGGIAGLVTLEDLIEELVGDITDESDREAPEAVEVGERRWLVSARMQLDELSDLVGGEVEDEDVDSVGGLLTKHLDRLPMLGDRVEVDGLRLTAEHIEGRRRGLSRVLVERIGDDDSEAEEDAKVLGA
ncbi:hemolysin family protein [Amnibacterium kyonggiense]|uniref:CBS domain containing-hemolysin-like protein n=1 Tax=Amnibacterium kyonggiense TaxID=595671 RepID=A0A4R7FMB8_9MICO|nr:hemolysin family protein [Amnibacterium kyonggiense]TDS77615.1 CBS domain containing-hemolysin-like protein [Amnibacterium kyonggiense]